MNSKYVNLILSKKEENELFEGLFISLTIHNFFNIIPS